MIVIKQIGILEEMLLLKNIYLFRKSQKNAYLALLSRFNDI